MVRLMRARVKKCARNETRTLKSEVKVRFGVKMIGSVSQSIYHEQISQGLTLWF